MLGSFIVLPVATIAVCCFHCMLEPRVKSWFGDVLVCYLSILPIIKLKRELVVWYDVFVFAYVSC